MANTKELADFFKNRGITQEMIAEKLGVSQQYVSRLLSGKTAFGKKQAQRFYENWGIQPAWLLTGDGPMVKTDGGINEEQVKVALQEIEGQRKIIEKSQEQIDRLLGIIESFQKQ